MIIKGDHVTESTPIRFDISFPDLLQSQAEHKIRALRAFASSKIPDLQFVSTEVEGHLAVESTFAIMVAVPAARLLWREFFSEFQTRHPGRVRVDVDGKSVFEGYSADPSNCPIEHNSSNS
jgi:hypothetical protein